MFPMQGNQSDETLYVDDVFSTYLYTGNGSTQTITNGIDLSGQGGMVWTKKRSGAYSHYLYDTLRGVNASLNTNDTSANDAGANELTAFNSTGFDLGISANVNGNTATYVAWTFRKAAKFFDVVTYTGDGVAGRTVAHSLGVAPGMIIVKRTSDAGYNWMVYHRSIGELKGLQLNTTDAAITNSFWNNTPPTAAEFSLGGSGVSEVNGSGASYVAYLFAHDTSADGIIQCGSFTANGGGSDLTINLGWEPQYVMMKNVSVSNDWHVFDTSRGFGVDRPINLLRANTSGAEQVETGSSYFGIYANGFKTLVSSGGFSYAAGNTVIYLAIRRPNKPPTSGTQVYNASTRNGNNSAGSKTGVGFSPDLWLPLARATSGGIDRGFGDRLRGNSLLNSATNDTETTTLITSFDQDGVTHTGSSSGNSSGVAYIDNFFRRAPGVFDEACYTGTGVAKTEAHNLGVAPELWIIKGRSGATAWRVGCTALANTDYLVFNSTAASATDATSWDSTYPTVSVFSLGTQSAVNTSSATYVAYLFATKAGISKVGSYTGNGSSQTINCGFSAGARFILIKRTDSTGDWYVWDSARGIVAGNDPHLSLNTTAAEVTTDDSIDPDNSGFIVNQLAATNINVTSATYIYLAFA